LSDPALEYDPTNRLDKYIDLTDEMKLVAQIIWESPAELVALSKTFSLPDSLLRYLKKIKKMSDEQLHQIRTQLSQLSQI
jgi:hypothetical protein